VNDYLFSKKAKKIVKLLLFRTIIDCTKFCIFFRRGSKQDKRLSNYKMEVFHVEHL